MALVIDHREWKRRILGTLGNDAMTFQSLLNKIRVAWPEYDGLHFNVHLMSMILNCQVRIVYAKTAGENVPYVVKWSE